MTNQPNPINDYILLRLCYITLYPLLARHGLLKVFQTALESANMAARSEWAPGGYPEACAMLEHYQGMYTMQRNNIEEVDKTVAHVGEAFNKLFVATYRTRQWTPLGDLLETFIKGLLDVKVSLKATDL